MGEYPDNIVKELEGLSVEGEVIKKGLFSQIVDTNPFTTQHRPITNHPIIKTIKVKLINNTANSKGLEEVISTPGLSLIKSIIKYIELMHVIRPCTKLLLEYIREIYEYYVYCVFLLFTPLKYQQRLLQKYQLEECIDYNKICTMYRVQSNYAKLKRYLFKVHGDLKSSYQRIAQEKVKSLLAPSLNPNIKLDDVHTLDGVFEKVVAIESCYYALNTLHKTNTVVLVLLIL
jgi:hypothetical protein